MGAEEIPLPYDQLLKELLRTFFAEFMQQFFPDAAAQLDLSQVTFLEQETATDVGRGERRSLDLVAQVARRDGSTELILSHVELQARPEPDFPERMFEYCTLLRRNYRLAVLPIVVYIQGGRGRAGWEQYRETVFGEVIVSFRFRRLRLRGFRAAEAVAGRRPLACALAALMDRRDTDPAELKVESLQGIGRSGLDEARQWLLVNFVETYLPLSGEQERRYRQMLAEQENAVAKQIEMTWGDRMREEGRRQGLLRGKRDGILLVLRTRFPSMPEEWTRRVEAIESPTELDVLMERALKAADLSEL